MSVRRLGTLFTNVSKYDISALISDIHLLLGRILVGKDWIVAQLFHFTLRGCSQMQDTELFIMDMKLLESLAGRHKAVEKTRMTHYVLQGYLGPSSHWTIGA